MPVALTTVDQLQAYFARITERAEHHAADVADVLPLLAGVLITLKDRGTQLEAHTWRGEAANALYVTIGGRRFALSYAHDVHAITVKSDSFRGELLACFDNNTSLSRIYHVFRPQKRRVA